MAELQVLKNHAEQSSALKLSAGMLDMLAFCTEDLQGIYMLKFFTSQK